jgi:Fe-S-cluster containining protein
MKKPIETLQENASGFFDKVQIKYSEQMECKSGCAKCCYTDISVFEVEADLVREWFNQQDELRKNELIEIWKTKTNDGACSFLYEEKCSIYEVRPIICRTQGAPLFLSNENALDFCPLNFKAGDPPKEDWLNLERLNTLLSFAAATVKRDSRIRLKKLKQEFLS